MKEIFSKIIPELFEKIKISIETERKKKKKPKLGLFSIKLININKKNLEKLVIGELVFLEVNVSNEDIENIDVYKDDEKIGRLPKSSPYGFNEDHVRYGIINYFDETTIIIALITSDVFVKRLSLSNDNFNSGDIANIKVVDNKNYIYYNDILLEEANDYIEIYQDYILNNRLHCSILQKSKDGNYLYSIIFK